MRFRLKLSGWQLFFLMGGLILVTIMIFGTGLLYGVRLAERDAPTELDEAESSAATGLAGGSDADDADGRNGTPQLVYEVQLSSHLRQEETTPVVEKLMAAGYQAFVVETRDSSNRSLYTVRIGPWLSIIEAAEAAEAFREHSGLEGLDPKIRHRPKPVIPGARTSSEKTREAG